MTATAGRRPRKGRLVRDELAPDDLTVLIRATGPTVDGAIADMVRDARDSGDTYAVTAGSGRREILYGVSMFALRSGRDITDVLAPFAPAPGYLAVTVGRLRAAGFAVVATGANPDHFDIQLVAGIREAAAAQPTDQDLTAAARRLVALAGPIRPNPAYAGDIGPREQR